MSILKKITLSNIVMSLITIIVVSVGIQLVVRAYVLNDISLEIKSQNEKIGELIQSKSSSDVNNYDEIKKIYRIINAKNVSSGIVFINDEHVSDFREKWFTKEEQEALSEAIQLNRDQGITRVEIGGVSFFLYAKSYTKELEFLTGEYVVYSLMYNEDVQQLTFNLSIVIIIILAMISLVTLLLNILISRRITKPIVELVDYTKAIKQDMHTEPVVLKTGDEIQLLSESIVIMVDNLNHKEQVQREFFEHVSHDFKTPITIISGYAEGIKNGIFEDNDEALVTIMDECKDLKSQIEDVIYLSRLRDFDERIQTNNREKHNITRVISDVLSDYEYLFTIKDIDIVTDMEPIAYVECNLEQTRLMMDNILSNCVKYTKDRISVKVKVLQEKVAISVEDNGNGFSEAVLNNPFDGLYISSNDGSGIGLQIIKKIVNQHQGKIQIKNSKSGGLYYIELPIGIEDEI